MSEQTPLLKDQPPPTAPPPAYQAPPAGYQAPPAGYQATQPPPAPSTTTVVVTPRPVVVPTALRDVPMQLTCPNCHRDVLTNVEYTNGLLTWLIVGLLVLLGFWLGCCLIPLCIDGLKDVNHICPSCGHMIGTCKKL